MMKMKPTLVLLVSHVFLGLGLFSLLAALFGAQSLSASAQGPSFVRIIHASPDIGTADVFVDGAKLADRSCGQRNWRGGYYRDLSG